MVRNRSAASKANNRSIIHEQSQLPSISPAPQSRKKQRQDRDKGDNVLIKERINKQHERVEQQIKKYDEILKKHKNIHQLYDIKKRVNRALHPVAGGGADKNVHGNHGSAHHHNNSSVLDASVLDSARRDPKMLGVLGVRLENKLDRPRGPERERVHHGDSSIVEDSVGMSHKYSQLPAIKNSPSHPRVNPQHKTSLPKPYHLALV